jgi:hypothetical protein
VWLLYRMPEARAFVIFKSIVRGNGLILEKRRRGFLNGSVADGPVVLASSSKTLSQRDISMTNHYAIVPNVRATLNDDGGVLLNLDTGIMFSINPVGARIWAKLQDGLTFSEILDSLSQDFDTSREQLKGDLESFLLQLTEKGLVTSEEGYPAKAVPHSNDYART